MPYNRSRMPGSNRSSTSSTAQVFRTSPYPAPMRGRSYSGGLIAFSRTQPSSYMMKSANDVSCYASYSSSSSAVAESQPKLALAPPETYYQWRQTFPSHGFVTDGRDVPVLGLNPNYQTADLHPTTSPTTTDEPATKTRINNPSSPPNLFAHLLSTPTSPPPSTSNRSQDLRFPGDLYTPTFIRKHGPKREGWCGLCQPGRWLVLKNSAFWYNKSFTYVVIFESTLLFQLQRPRTILLPRHDLSLIVVKQHY